MGAPAARLNDSVLGADTHIVMVPSGTGSVPTPIPGHVFSGTLTSDASPDVQIEGSRGGRGRNRGHEQPIAPADAPRGVVSVAAVKQGDGQPGLHDRHDQRQGCSSARRPGAHLQRPD